MNNNLSLNAASGDATVINSGNNSSATSGDATTNLTSLNLINQQIIGQNVLLVFVNVLGQWTGLIYNAPAGTTSADLGGGIDPSSAVCGSCGGISVNSTTNNQINNNIYLNSVSGNATVGDSNGGIATTGDASASVNLVNVVNSQLSLSNWFGLLFINVFGSWQGNLQAAPVKAPDKDQPPSNNTPSSNQVFSFAASAGGPANYFTLASAPSPGNTGTGQTPSSHPKVLGSATPSMNGSPADGHNLNAVISSVIGGLLIFLGLLFGLDRRKKAEQ